MKTLRQTYSESDIVTLRKTGLFNGVSAEALLRFMHETSYKLIAYERGETILTQGARLTKIGIIMEGAVAANSVYVDGKKAVDRYYERNDLLGFAIASSELQTSRWFFKSLKPTTILWFDWNSLTRAEASGLPLRMKILKNILKIHANVGIRQEIRIGVLAQRNTRDKILFWLTTMCAKKGKTTITANMNRNEFAEYLCVSKQMLVLELHKLTEDGVISYTGNTYTLLTSL
jgi:CRP-like cAMP-binding protein